MSTAPATSTASISTTVQVSSTQSHRSAALLVGINYVFHPSSATMRLNGCWNDAVAFATLLTAPSPAGGLRMPARDVSVVVDITPEGARATSRAALLQSIYDLALRSWTDALDVAVFTFSGHGAQTPDRDGDEAADDGLDEAICPSDACPGPLITDDELARVFQRFNPKTTVFAVFDACHSGSALDLPFVSDAPAPQQAQKQAPWRNRVVAISGCVDSGTSADAYNKRTMRYSGALSSALIQAAQELGTRAPLRAVHARTNELLAAGGFEQRSVLSSSVPLDSAVRLFQPWP